MSEATLFYVKANILLLVGLSLFYVLFLSSEKYFETAPKKWLLQLARATLLLSLLAPFILPSIQTHLPYSITALENFKVFAEGANRRLEPIVKSADVKNISNSGRVDQNADVNIALILKLIFGLGFAFFALRFLRALYNLRSMLNDSILLRRTSYGGIYLSSRLQIPVSFFYFGQNIVVLPLELIAEPEYLQLALAHEHQHIRQGDVKWAYFTEILKILFWLNPAAYIWSSRLDFLSELSCDEQVLARRKIIKIKDYAHCLLAFAEKALRPGASQPLVSGMASHNTKTLSRRIIMFTAKSLHQTRKFKLKALALAILIVGAAMSLQVRAAHELSVNEDLQKIVDQALVDGLKTHKAQSGFAILADPHNGQILAVSRQILKNSKYTNASPAEFMQTPFEPYSLVKPLVAALVINKEKVNEQTVLDARGGKVTFGGREFYDWKDHGMITVSDTIAQSSFVGTIRLAQMIGETELVEGMKRFGVSESQLRLKTGQEAAYNLPLIANGMGVFFMTVEDILRAYSAFSNGGELLKFGDYNADSVQAQSKGRILSEGAAQRVKFLLLQTMQTGTGRWAQSTKYTIAGKTGTGYISSPKPDEKYGKGERAEFVGFAPYDNPRLISLVIIDNPSGSAHGSSQAAPVVTSILNQSLKHLNVEWDKKSTEN